MNVSEENKPLLVGIVVAHLLVTSMVWRDLGHRTPEQVRGPKALWRTLSALNTSGSVAYLLFGRTARPVGYS